LNKGLPENLKESFSARSAEQPISRPSIENKKKKFINPNWLAGFISAEGCFLFRLKSHLKSPLNLKLMK